MQEQHGKLLSLGSGVALNMKFRIDLIHILLDAAFGEKQPFRDLAVRKPLRHQLYDLKFPLCQRIELAQAGIYRFSRFCRFAQLDDPHDQVTPDFPCQYRLQAVVVLHKRHHKAVRCGIGKRP